MLFDHHHYLPMIGVALISMAVIGLSLKRRSIWYLVFDNVASLAFLVWALHEVVYK
jgi:hypothetical protein